MNARPGLRTAAALGVSGVLVGGCVTLLPKTPPVQLYRFGFEARVAAAPGGDGSNHRGVRLALTSVSLPAAAGGVGILTSRDNSVAYIAGARWAAPATVLVAEAAQKVFSSTDVVLTRDPSATLANLTLEVRTLEARYTDAVAPTVRITTRAILTRSDGRPLAERTFAVARPALANRVGAIVAAYDLAVSDDLEAIARWSAATAPSGSTAIP